MQHGVRLQVIELLEQALSWAGHAQNTACSFSHYDDEMDHGFQHVLRAWAERHEVCMQMGNVISSELLVRATTPKASGKSDAPHRAHLPSSRLRLF